ncbi:hypothetical protein DAT1711_23080 [Enterococcus cecorum]
MKIGMRKPSLKKSISARTTGKLKRTVKKAVIPGYGKKGVGWIKNPKKAAYNKIYKKTTFGINPLSSVNTKVRPKQTISKNTIHQIQDENILEVVGTYYTDAERILRNVVKDKGESWNTNGYQYHDLELVLIPEPDNKYDSNAIAVYSDYPTPKNAKVNRSGKIGYLPKDSGITLNGPKKVNVSLKEGFGDFYIKINTKQLFIKGNNFTHTNKNHDIVDISMMNNTMVNKYIFALLAIFLGILGVHWFYAKKFKKGLLYFAFCWTSIPFFLSLYDGIKALLIPSDSDNLIQI